MASDLQSSMYRITQTTPDRLEMRSGGGCLALFGLPFLAVGIFLLLIVFKVLHLEGGNPIPEIYSGAWYAMVGSGLAFALPGFGLMTGRGWVIIDRGSARVLTAWGMLVPFRYQERSLSEFQAVRIVYQLQSSSNNGRSQPQYIATLQAVAGGKDIQYCNTGSYALTRDRAAHLAEFIRLPLVDATSQHDSVIAPEHAEESFPTRLAEGEVTDNVSAPLPVTMRSQVTAMAGSVQIAITGDGNRAGKLSLVPGIIFLVFFAAFILPVFLPLVKQIVGNHDIPLPVRIYMGIFVSAFIGIPLLSILIPAIKRKYSSTLVSVNTQGITIEQRAGWSKTTTQIPANEILDLDYSQAQTTQATFDQYPAFSWLGRMIGSGGITIKAQRGIYSFAAGLPDDEVLYLYQLTKNALGGKGTSG